MNFLKNILCIFVLFIICANVGALKVIFYKNTTSKPTDIGIKDNVTKPGEIVEGNIIVVPPNCKQGYIYDSKKCRRVAVWVILISHKFEAVIR